MSWKALAPAGRSCAGSEVAFAIRASKGDVVRLCISIRPDVLRKLQVQDREPMRLESDGKLCRLIRAAGKLSKPVRLNKSGRATWECSCTGQVAELWTQNACSMTPLPLVEISTEHVVFELPEWEVASE